ncbi:MFS transporter [Alkalihalobacterium alkalinitrilicum]|uniref:MFS transporter n=1 Tax=Alkalihalobacterium alkalinitrilicum TaxID=427920 RepID=UPI0009953B46|nr:MFS transporter [Alkalihalobacterium alkalinitrilicum]
MELVQNKSTLNLKSEKFIYVGLFINILIVVMNTTMFNVAIPEIIFHFSLTPTTASWIVTSYSVVFAVGTVLYSKLSQMKSISSLLTVGLILFGIGSIVGILSANYAVLLFARVIQASGACCVSALGIVIISRYIPIQRRGRGMGVVSAASTLGFGLGPLVGGFITQYLGWSFLFVISLIGVLTVPLYLYYLPKDPSETKSIDFLGILYLLIGVVSLLIFVTTSYSIVLLGILCFFLFWLHIKRVKNPIIPPNLLSNKVYIFIILIGFCIFFTNFSLLFLSPLLLAKVFNSSSAMIGLIIFPGAMLSAILSIFIGRWMDRVGSMVIIGFGISCILVATSLFTLFSHITSITVIFFYLVSSIGFSSITMSLPNYLSNYLSSEEFASSIGILQLCQFIGGAFGVSVSGKLLESEFFTSMYIPFWNHGIQAFGISYFFLVIISCLALISFYFLKKSVVINKNNGKE